MSTRSPVAVAVIVGSTRAGRIGGTVADWFMSVATQRTSEHFDLVDLAAAKLPDRLTGEPDAAVDEFASRIAAADAIVVVTPEYNHGYPASLKQAIDLVRGQWRAKPVGFVAYGGMAGGMRAVEQLRQVFAELRATTVREVVGLHDVHGLFEDGRLIDPDGPAQAAHVMLDELGWWARPLRAARSSVPYPGFERWFEGSAAPDGVASIK